MLANKPTMFPITTTSSPSPPETNTHSPTSPSTSPQKYPHPPLSRSNTLPAEFGQSTGLQKRNSIGNGIVTDRTRLAPEDAIYMGSPPSRRTSADRGMSNNDRLGAELLAVTGRHNLGGNNTEESRGRRRHKNRSSRSRGRKAVWKKLLWVRQSYPDNYTDSETFLEHLQRNPRLQPYEFWPLVADSTVIVQQVCAVTIFICCFAGIYLERVEPTTIVGVGTLFTVLAWFVYDDWVRKEERSMLARRAAEAEGVSVGDLPLPPSPAVGSERVSAMSSTTSLIPSTMPVATPSISRPPSTPAALNLTLSALPTSATQAVAKHAHSTSASSLHSSSSLLDTSSPPRPPPPKAHSRISTLKSALLINFTLLGLSPILKSLTLSTSSDSIWALSTLLFIINVFFFDYTDLRPPSGSGGGSGSGIGAGAGKFQASLSTNAALMASTVLASRLPSTLHVFSLTLFSIEVFGLFPVFRRHLRWQSWRGHVLITAALVMGAGAGVGIVVSGGGWKAGILGGTVGNLCAGVGMGGASWYMLTLQKYKNAIIGPWDPARPVIRQWV